MKRFWQVAWISWNAQCNKRSRSFCGHRKGLLASTALAAPAASPPQSNHLLICKRGRSSSGPSTTTTTPPRRKEGSPPPKGTALTAAMAPRPRVARRRCRRSDARAPSHRRASLRSRRRLEELHLLLYFDRLPERQFGELGARHAKNRRELQ